MVESLGHPVTGDIQDEIMVNWVDDNIVRDQNRDGVLRKMKGYLVAAGFLKWGDEVLTDLKKLASGAVDTCQLLLSDMGLLLLDRFLYFCVDPIPVCSLLVELTFSQLKRTRSNNEGSAMTNVKMWTRMQILHPGREQRRKILRKDGEEYSHVEHLDTFRHLIAWVKGMRETCAVYTEEKMSATPAPAVFHRQRTKPEGEKVGVSTPPSFCLHTLLTPFLSCLSSIPASLHPPLLSRQQPRT